MSFGDYLRHGLQYVLYSTVQDDRADKKDQDRVQVLLCDTPTSLGGSFLFFTLRKVPGTVLHRYCTAGIPGPHDVRGMAGKD